MMKRALFALCFVAQYAFAQVVQVPWTVETSPIASNQAGDPAFFPSPGLVVGTDPAALGVYFWRPGDFPTIAAVGLVNGADARDDVLVVASQSSNALFVFVHTADAGVVEAASSGFNPVSPGHVALRRERDGGLEVFVDDSANTIERYQMIVDAGSATFVSQGTFTVPERPGGLAVDDRTGELYAAMPTLGVLVVERNGTQRFAVSIDAGTLGSLVGGIGLAPMPDGGALIFTAAPSEAQLKLHFQNGAPVATVDIRDPNDPGVFVLLPRFLDVLAQPVLPDFPRGVLTVQDGVSANYKLVSLAALERAIGLPPPVDAGAGDAGAGDAGVADAGTDAGSTGGGAGGGGGTTGSPVGPQPGVQPMDPSCGCSGSPFALLPALLSLWFVRRRRSAP